MKVGLGKVVLVNGEVGVINGLGGQVSSSFVTPTGEIDQAKEIPQGMVMVHLMDEKGETVMEKHPTQMRFLTTELLVPIADLKECPPERVPVSRRRQAVAAE